MVDRIDIFGDDETLEEPEVPKFLGVEQERLTKSQYESGFVDFFSQYYGMDSLGSGLGDTGINVDDDKDDITELTTPGIKDEGDGGQEFFSNLESLTSDPGGGITTGFYGEAPSELTIKGDAYATAQQFNSYGDYLKTTEFTDRVPMVENLYDPLLSGNFADIDFVEAFTGSYEGVKTDVEEAPAKIGDLISAGLKGNLTEKQTETLISGLFSSTANPLGMAIGAFTSGDTLKDSYGKNTFRPSNPLLGLAFDLNMANEFAVAANVKAAQAVARELSLIPGQIDTGFRGLFGASGKIDRNPNSGYYRINNVPGMTQKMAKAYDAFSKGLTHTSFDPTTGRGITLEEAGFVSVGYVGHDGADLSGQKGVGGYYTDKGTYVDKFGRGAQYGTTASVSAAAAKAGISYDEMMSAIEDARNGKGTVGSNVKSIQQDKLNKAEAARIAEEKRKEEERERQERDRQAQGYLDSLRNNDPGFTKDDFDTGTSFDDDDDIDEAGWATGGKVGYAMGTPAPGVPAQPSGFVDAPPSQVAEGQKVADNRDMEVKEGTYVLNAAAVEFAGEQDIRKMIMDAQKEAVRRGIVQDGGSRASELVDIAVSSGEVTIAPHLVKIIGEDRLEKINKRGIRKTEQRIAENGQQPVGAAGGGFIDIKKFATGDKVTVYRGEPLDPSKVTATDYGYGKEDVGKFHTPSVKKAQGFARGAGKGNQVIKSRKVTIEELFDGVEEAWKTQAKKKTDYFAKMPKSELNKNIKFVRNLKKDVLSGKRSIETLTMFLQEQVFHDDKSKINFIETFKNDPKSAGKLAGRALTKVATKATPPLAILGVAAEIFTPSQLGDATLNNDSFLDYSFTPSK